MDAVREVVLAQEEQENMRKREQLRRKGYNFIKIINEGDIDRIHSVHDIKIVERANAETGETDYEPYTSSGVVEYEEDPTTGDKVFFILDDEFNRFWLARQIQWEEKRAEDSGGVYSGLRIENKKIAVAVRALFGKEYKIHLSESEKLNRDKAAIEKKLTHIRHQEEALRKKENEKEKQRIRPKEDKPVHQIEV